MKNRFTELRCVLAACLLLFGVLNSHAQFTFNPGDDTFVLDANCEAIFYDLSDPSVTPPTVTYTGPGNLVTAGINVVLTGYMEGQTMTGVQSFTVFYEATDDQGNVGMFDYPVMVVDNTMPMFTNPPGDITIDCLSDIPTAMTIEATDNCDSAYPQQVAFTSTLNPSTTTQLQCQGGTVTRVFETTDASGNTATHTQVITITPNAGDPTMTVPLPNAMVLCQNADINAWIADQYTFITNNAMDDCGIDDIDDDYVAGTFTTDCGSIDVKFTIIDACGGFIERTATYTVMDDEAPVLSGVPADATIECDDPVPAPAMVTSTDNCDAMATTPTYTLQTTQVIDGTCAEYSYEELRIWEISDACGNMSIDTQTIVVVDITAPTFDVPMDLVLDCGSSTDPTDTGMPTNIVEACGVPNTATFTDITTVLSCVDSVRIERTWSISDVCGNTNTALQTILLRDITAPTFTTTPAAMIDIDCADFGDITVTGEPTGATDNCDPNVVITGPVDLQTAGSCDNEYTVQRTWTITDRCGNTTDFTQTINVSDMVAPVFTAEAIGQTNACTNDASADVLFNNWITNNGGAMATDNCQTNLIITAYNSGTTDPASLPTATCPTATVGIYRTQTVDFIVDDGCMNYDTTTASFTIIDNTAPVLSNCPSDESIDTDPGVCEAVFTLMPPVFEDECNSTTTAFNPTMTQNFTSQAVAGNEANVPLDSLMFSFAVNAAPSALVGDVQMQIDLTNVDSEEPTEIFDVIGEDGTVIGQTNQTASQCEDVTSNFTIAKALFDAWAIDGQVDIEIRPIAATGFPGSFAANDICPGGSSATVTLDYTQQAASNMIYEYAINGGTRVQVNPVMAVDVTLELEENEIEYFVRDCAGNEATCSYVITVEDNELPVITCPADITVSTDANVCQATVDLPLFTNISDNCGATKTIINSSPLPFQVNEQFITYNFDPNHNEFLANQKVFTFIGVAGNAYGADVQIEIELQADADDPDEYFTITTDDGTVLGITSPSDCGTVGSTIFTIPVATYNMWAGDGFILMTATPNPNPTISAGEPGNGINPCMPNVVNGTGQSDGVSYMKINIIYEQVVPTYDVTGATDISLQSLSPLSPPTHVLNQGVNTVTYTILDDNGNEGSCSYEVFVEDTEIPDAQCFPATTIQVNPSGLDNTLLDVADFENGSTDNCTIDTMYLVPDQIACDEIGNVVTIQLVVRDEAGNEGFCNALVEVEAIRPDITFDYNCDSDTLFLFANPPASSGNNIWDFEWSGPDGFISNEENPFIPNVNDDNTGTYAVTITGFGNQCSSDDNQYIFIPEIETPILTFDDEVCFDEDIVLTAAPATGNDISYEWYEGIPPFGNLLATTTNPEYTVQFPHAEGNQSFYMIVTEGDCSSDPSPVATIMVSEPPTPFVDDATVDVCAGGCVQLGSPVSGANLTYTWTGPCGFTFDGQYPPELCDVTECNEGVYTLIIAENGCEAAPVTTVVTVLDTPDQPTISNGTTAGSPACNGEAVTLITDITDGTLYRWNGPNNLTFTSASNSFTITNAQIGVHNGMWNVVVAYGNCESEASAPTEIFLNPLPNVQINVESTACDNSPLTLSATNHPGAIYNWLAPDNTTHTGQTITVAALEGNYTVVVTDANGCQNTAIDFIAINDAPQITSTSNNAPSCPDGPFDVQLLTTVFPTNGSYTYQWTGPNDFLNSNQVGIIPEAIAQDDNGAYQVVVEDANGCFSNQGETVVDLGLLQPTPNQPVADGDNPFCEGESININTGGNFQGTDIIYHWITPSGANIQTPNNTLEINNVQTFQTGDYSVYLTIDGCVTDTSALQFIQVNEIPVVAATSNSAVCEGEPIYLEVDCIPGATYEWSGPAQFNSTFCEPIRTDAIEAYEGTYEVIVEVDGCASAPASTFVQINEVPNAPIVQGDTEVCVDAPGASLTLAINPNSTEPGYEYQWFDANGTAITGVVTTPVVNITTLDEFPQGTYNFYAVIINNGCASAASELWTVNFSAIPNNTAFAGVDMVICEEDEVMLNATPPSEGTGGWALVGGNPAGVSITNPDQGNTTVNGLLPAGGLYTFEWSLSNGACVDYSVDSVGVTISYAVDADAGSSIDTCGVSSILLNAQVSNGETGSWSQPPSQEIFVTIVNPTAPNAEVTGLTPDNTFIFTWTLDDQDCGLPSDDVLVQVRNDMAVTELDFIDCGDGCTDISATAAVIGTGKWSAVDPDIEITNPDNPNTSACNLKTGDNYLVWTLNEGECGLNAIDTLIITYKYAPVAVNDDMEVGFADFVTIDVAANDEKPADYFVNILNEPIHGFIEEQANGVYSYGADINFVGEDFFIYEICSNSCECSTGQVTFTIGGDVTCEVPTIITPNNDRINDVFVVPCLIDATEYPNNSVSIFNQWGDEVFTESPYQNKWDGTYNGADLPAGTYFYVVKFGITEADQVGFLIVQR